MIQVVFFDPPVLSRAAFSNVKRNCCTGKANSHTHNCSGQKPIEEVERFEETHLEARSINFELTAPRPTLPARKAMLARMMVGLRPSLASNREDEKLVRAATSTW